MKAIAPRPFRIFPVKPVVFVRGFSSSHNGVDFDLAIGDPVFSIGRGRVVQVSADDESGNFVIIDGTDEHKGWRWSYAHLSVPQVFAGQTVDEGQQVGLGGNTGHVIATPPGDGSHLHFTIRPLSAVGGKLPFVDPLHLLPPLPKGLV